MLPNLLIYSLFLIPLLVIGILSSYSDFRYGKIKNIYILLGIGWVIFLYSFLFFYIHLDIHQTSNISYLNKLLLNGLIALIVGYSIWYMNLWAAGDAKLFFITSLLLPLEFYSKSYILYFPSFVLLLDAFILVLFYLILKIIIRESFLGIKKLKKKLLNYSQYKNKYINLNLRRSIFLKKGGCKIALKGLLKIGKIFITYLSIFIFLQLFRNNAGLLLRKFISNLGIIYLLFFAFQKLALRKLLANKKISFTITMIGLAGSLYLVISDGPASLLRIIKMVLFFMVLVGFSIKLLNLYIDNNEVTRIKVKNIVPGVFPVAKDIIKINKLLKEDGVDFRIGNTISSDGFSKKQTKIVRELFKNNPDEEITIYKTFPFAPFLLIAVLVSIVTRSSFIPFVSQLFHIIK